MLDQNTDRMWYVIGAVIIGAAIIFILNGTMPQLFASVGGTFEDKTEDVMADVESIGGRGDGSQTNVSVNVLDRTGELEHHFMFNMAVTNPVPSPIPTGLSYPHAATKAPIRVNPGETLVFKKTSIEGESGVSGDNYWRVSLLNADKGYVDRFVTTDDTYTFVVPEKIQYIWASYHMDSDPSILAVR